MTKLKAAFENARKNNNIDMIFPELLASTFYVVGLSGDERKQEFDFAQSKGPKQGEMCVTASENPKLVSFDEWDKIKVTGGELLKTTPKNAGIMIAYESGGDYLTRDQIDWFIQNFDF